MRSARFLRAPRAHILCMSLMLTAVPAAAQTGTVLRGDVTADGQVSAVDALAVLAHLVGRPLPPGYSAWPAGDADGNGQVSAFDAAVILGYRVGRDQSAYPVGQRIAACTPVLSATSAAPGSTLRLGGMPTSVGDSTLAAYLRLPGDTARFPVIASRGSAGGDLDVIAPMHPRAPMEGGAVEIVVVGRDGAGAVLQCGAVGVHLAGLPNAPGTAQAVKQQMTRTLDGVATAFGTTTAQLASADPATLPEALRPLAAAAWVMQGPNNPNSVQHIMDGSAPLLKGQRIDPKLLDGILASSGVLAGLRELADSMTKLGPPPPGVSLASLRAISTSAGIQPLGLNGQSAPALSSPGGDVSTADLPTITTAEQLNYWMKVQADLERNAARAAEVINTMGIALAGAGLLTGPIGAAVVTLVGAEWFVISVVAEHMQNLLPNELGPITFTASITAFQEDQTVAGQWSAAKLTARGGTWSLSPGTIVGGVLTGAGGAIGRMFKKLVDSMKVAGFAGDALAEAYNQFWGQVANRLGSQLSGGVLQQGPYTYGPVDVTDAKFSTAFTTSNGVVAVDPADKHLYRAVGAGSTGLVVRTRPEWFAGRIAEGRTPLTVSEIRILVVPTVTQMRTGAEQQVHYRIAGAEDLRATWSASCGTITSEGGAHAIFRAPQSPATCTVTARHLTRTNRSGSAEIEVVRLVTINVSPQAVSVAPGAQQTFTAAVEGTDNTAVTWSATRGTITAQGVFTAPQDTGIVTVTATSVADPTRSAAALVSVARVIPVVGPITAGSGHSCGITTGGEAYCWGDNAQGQLGDGTQLQRRVPARVAGNLEFMQIDAANGRTCAVTTAGAAYCWGRNTYGELGDGTRTDRSVPTPVATTLRFTSIQVGGHHTCALTSSGAPYCWGMNVHGQLGVGIEPEYSTIPLPVAGGPSFIQLDAGYFQTCGVTSGGAVYCWGGGWPLGRMNASKTAALKIFTPERVPASEGLSFARILTGQDFTCGITTGGAAYCWGRNHQGFLGNGSTSLDPSPEPQPVSGGHRFVQLAGVESACGLTTAGAVYCWGPTFFGGTVVSTPTLISGASVFQVIAHGTSVCGIDGSGAAYCWGTNRSGEVGDGTSTARSTPARLSGGLSFPTTHR